MSQRDRLLGRKPVGGTFAVQVEDPAPAQEKLAEAERSLRFARGKHGEDSKQAKAADRKVKAAKKALDACWETLHITPLPAVEYQRLIAEHPPTEKQQAAEEEWNPETFEPALLELCIDNGMSADDWRDFLASNATRGEGRDLWLLTLSLHERSRAPESVTLPKDSAAIRSLLSNLT